MDEPINDDDIEHMLFDIPSGSEASDLDSEEEVDDFLSHRANVFMDGCEDYLSITSPTTRAAALYDEQRSRLERSQEADNAVTDNADAPVLACEGTPETMRLRQRYQGGSPVPGSCRSSALSPVPGSSRSSVSSPVPGSSRSSVSSPVPSISRSSVPSEGTPERMRLRHRYLESSSVPGSSRSPAPSPVPSISRSAASSPVPGSSRSPAPSSVPSISRSAASSPVPASSRSPAPSPVPSISRSSAPSPAPLPFPLLQVENSEQYVKKVKWNAGKENNHVNNPPVFLDRAKVNISGFTPYDFFTHLFPQELFDHIVKESLRYAVQNDNHTFQFTRGDLQLFLGMNIIMTYIKYPQTRMYWSSIIGLGLQIISETMPVKRFEIIKRFIHFVDNDREFELKINDRFWKIRSITNKLHNSFHAAVVPEEHQSVDEMLVPFKGKSSLKQYIPNKPKKWGFKIWVRASPSGYVSCFELYEGKVNTRRSTFGPVGDSVIRLCHDIHGKNYKLYMDNLFTSLPLLRYLQSENIHVLGTVRMNRVKDGAQKLVDPKLLSRGSSSITTSEDNITIVRWVDNNPVHTISTFAGAEPESEITRYDRKEKTRLEIPRPFSIGEYNKNMGGVDMLDRMIAHYPHGFKNKRWYLRIFFQLVNMSLVNAWLLYKKKTGENMPLLAFKASVASSLITVGTMSNQNRKRRGRPSLGETDEVPKKRTALITVAEEIRFDHTDHYPEKLDVANAPRCHDKLCRSRTRFRCEKCQVPVCPACMKNFHIPQSIYEK